MKDETKKNQFERKISGKNSSQLRSTRLIYDLGYKIGMTTREEEYPIT
jgi:hypothetical protein